ncbi:MAG TPA: potassium/proton antiporter [Proteiniphilum sp.]|nr:potassium/proton antiporter [Proteiniphilum sp.]HPJ51196.1 potassium/proton antiporter [Proteiniphilum sp.]HPR20860.1 potassium/proton antiporter [Proteiniphilum sp.]
MMISTEILLLTGSVLFFISMLVGKAGHRFGVPVLLLFLLVGMIFGSDGFGLMFQNVQTAHTIGTLCLCIILFSGGLDTRFSDIRPVIVPGVVLATLGVFLTAIITGLFTWWISGLMFPSLGIGLLTALLLASTVSSTDSASVFGILRSKGVVLKNNLRPMLEMESGSNDPMAYMLTILFMGIIQSGEDPNLLLVIGSIFLQLAIGAVIGFVLGRLAVRLINGIRMDNASLYPVLLLMIGIFVFAATYFLKGNGYLAIYIAGLVIGNSKFVHKRTSMKFMDGFAWMSQILLFLTLGLLVNPAELLEVLLPAVIIAFFMIFFARPLSVFITLLPFRKIGFKDKLYTSWVGLRGAVPIIFAIMPLAEGIEGARWIFNIVFVITIVSLLVQGTSLPLVAKWLKLADKPSKFKAFEDFDVEFSEEIKSAMTEIEISEETLKYGKNLLEMPLPDKTLVVMVKRDEQYFVPTGQTALYAGDKLLVISDDEEALRETYTNMGIYDFTYQRNR